MVYLFSTRISANTGMTFLFLSFIFNYMLENPYLHWEEMPNMTELAQNIFFSF